MQVFPPARLAVTDSTIQLLPPVHCLTVHEPQENLSLHGFNYLMRKMCEPNEFYGSKPYRAANESEMPCEQICLHFHVPGPQLPFEERFHHEYNNKLYDSTMDWLQVGFRATEFYPLVRIEKSASKVRWMWAFCRCVTAVFFLNQQMGDR